MKTKRSASNGNRNGPDFVSFLLRVSEFPFNLFKSTAEICSYCFKVLISFTLLSQGLEQQKLQEIWKNIRTHYKKSNGLEVFALKNYFWALRTLCGNEILQ